MIKGIFFQTALALGLTVSGAVWAQDIPGAEADAFQAARADWLAGHDLGALQSLTALSQEGNTAAQILLARIGEMPHSYAPLTKDMDRKARIALTRQDKGLSGTSWLEAADHPLAAVLQEAKAAFGEDAVAAASRQIDGLLAFGESQAATEVVFKLNDGLFVQETHDVLALHGARLLPVVDVVADEVSRQLVFEGKPTSLTAAPTEGARLQTGRVPIWAQLDDPDLRSRVMDHASASPDWAPLVEACQTVCPGDVESCVVAGAAQVALIGPFPFASPLQSLISEQDYHASARITGDVLRRIGSVALPTADPLAASQCLAQAVAKAQG